MIPSRSRLYPELQERMECRRFIAWHVRFGTIIAIAVIIISIIKSI